MQIWQAIQWNTASISIECADRSFRGSEAALHASGNQLLYEWEAAALTLTLNENNVCTVSLRVTGTAALRLQRIRIDWPPNKLPSPPDTRDYVQLYHSRDFAHLSGVRPLHRPNSWSNVAEASSMVTVLAHRCGQEAILLGALPPYGDCFTDFPVLYDQPHRDGTFGVGIHLQSNRRIVPGRTETLAHLAVQSGSDGNELLEQYGRLARERLAPSIAFKQRVTGWNSWDYYAGAIRQEDVIANAKVARERFGDALQYIIVDEGYERQWGVWAEGWKFSDGFAHLCEQIRQSGYEPGIWTAPLMVNVYTPLYREHPDWFVGDGQGNIFTHKLSYGNMAVLDITHPEVVEHIASTFAKLRQDGFTYFKCDFTQMLIGSSTFASNELSYAGMLRKLFATIRASIGSDAYLLACGAPYESVVGIVDACRSTGDIHNFWSQILQNIRSMLARWWMQGTFGNTDPDFAIVRCTETTDDVALNRRLSLTPWKAGSNWCSGREMNAAEAKTLLLACLVTGGDLILGDALGKLNATGNELLERLLEHPVTSPGRPLNLFAHDGDELPIVIAQSGERKLLVLFNLSDDYRKQQLPDHLASSSDSPWIEFWSGEPDRSPLSGAITLAPRSAQAWWVAAD
jgi:hypothetical protein